MNEITLTHYQSPAGELALGVIGDKLCLCDWVNRKNSDAIIKRLALIFDASVCHSPRPLHKKISHVLDEYFDGKRKTFDIPIATAGTAFQKKVWHALIKIPYGTTTTYKGLSISIGKPAAVRAVANANGANALSLFIPCHRIIGSDGSLTGYAGGLEAKRTLLCLEKANITAT